jgi:hypothetical protein
MPVPVQIDVDGPVEDLPPGLRALIYFFCSECLANSRGLRGLADRIEVTGGTLSVGSPPGGPTRIGAEIPIPC